MLVYRRLEDVPENFGPCALTIGNFDGVHAGHREIMRQVARVAVARGLKASVMTFHPHPMCVVAPSRAPLVISTPEQRAAMMHAEGIDQVLILPFDHAVAQWSPEYFAREILSHKLKARVVLVGEDFHFGHKHAGDTEMLAEFGRHFGFDTELIDPIMVRGQRVSSSLVRDLVRNGRVSKAARMLARPFALEGAVVSGHGVGAKQTVPTLNLGTTSALLPMNGVYITRTTDLDLPRSFDSITNVGHRPTFDGDALTIETFLLSPLTGETPHRIRVDFLRRVRDERKFESPEQLKAQIMRDVSRAQAFFRRLGKWVRVR